MRLFQSEGDMENEGRVEFCSSGRWGLVCYNFWDNNDAKVICRQLGYNVEGKLTFLIVVDFFNYLTCILLLDMQVGV